MKINYDIEMEEIISTINERCKLLLHSCCGPCSSAVLERLSRYFDITILYYNPNIYPEEEYNKRLKEQKKLVHEINNSNIIVESLTYDENEFLSKIKGLEEEKEGGKRCSICYHLRLEKVAEYAKEHDFKYFTTTLTVSPYKHSDILNEIGINLAKKYNLIYLCSDFKKKNGYKRSIELSKKYNLYRQDYCGCRFSLKEKENYNIYKTPQTNNR